MEETSIPFEAIQERGFLLRENWEEYDLTQTIASFLKPKKHGEWIEYGVWPLYLLVIFSDTEPHIPKKRFLWPRVVVWDRITCSSLGVTSHKWFSIGKRPRKKLGVLEIGDGEYHKTWNATAQNERRRWLRLKKSMYSKQ